MKKPNFFNGIAIALGLSIGGALLLNVLDQVFSGSAALRVVIAAVVLIYLLYLFAHSRRRNGKFVLIGFWLLSTGLTIFFNTGITSFILNHCFFIWLVRSYCRYTHILPAFIDGGLLGVGIVAAAWAAVTTSSFFLTLWCFYLVQSVFPFIQNRALPLFVSTRDKNSNGDEANQCRAFNRACYSAQAAIIQLSKSH